MIDPTEKFHPPEQEPMEMVNAKIAREGFLRAMQDPALKEFDNPDKPATKDAKRASCLLAKTLGECRIYGAKLEEHDGTLTVPMASAASEHLLEIINDARKNLKKLSKHDIGDLIPQEAPEGMPAGLFNGIPFEELSMEIIEDCFDQWAARIALEEAYVGALDDDTAESSGYGKLWLKVLDETNAIEDEMKKHIGILTCIAGTNELENWRNGIVEPYETLLPWFLDGTLEKEIGKESINESEEEWSIAKFIHYYLKLFSEGLEKFKQNSDYAKNYDDDGEASNSAGDAFIAAGYIIAMGEEKRLPSNWGSLVEIETVEMAGIDTIRTLNSVAEDIKNNLMKLPPKDVHEAIFSPKVYPDEILALRMNSWAAATAIRHIKLDKPSTKFIRMLSDLEQAESNVDSLLKDSIIASWIEDEVRKEKDKPECKEFLKINAVELPKFLRE